MLVTVVDCLNDCALREKKIAIVRIVITVINFSKTCVQYVLEPFSVFLVFLFDFLLSTGPAASLQSMPV